MYVHMYMYKYIYIYMHICKYIEIGEVLRERAQVLSDYSSPGWSRHGSYTQNARNLLYETRAQPTFAPAKIANRMRTRSILREGGKVRKEFVVYYSGESEG